MYFPDFLKPLQLSHHQLKGFTVKEFKVLAQASYGLKLLLIIICYKPVFCKINKL